MHSSIVRATISEFSLSLQTQKNPVGLGVSRGWIETPVLFLLSINNMLRNVCLFRCVVLIISVGYYFM